MMIRSFSIVMLVWISGSAQAQYNDSVAYCTDSLFLQVNSAGEQYLQWQLGPQTTLESLTAASGLSLEDLRILNPILHFRDIEPCDRILIPNHAKELTWSETEDTYPVYYRVRRGETIFGIAHRILDVKVDILLIINDMEDFDLTPGQLLRVGFLQSKFTGSRIDSEPHWASNWMRPQGYVVDTQMVNMSPTKSLRRQRGVAWWNKDMKDPNMFALHRSAPLNSLIEIRNPMFGRSVWAKVIGTIPPTYTEDISIIVSPGVAKYLGAIDGRFYVEMSYEAD